MTKRDAAQRAALASDGPHRRADGTFYSPWPDAAPHGFADFLRWSAERWRTPRANDPAPGWLLRAEPRFDHPRAPREAITATWVGHSTFLLQVGGLNVLTDPMWSERASPVSWAGPRRQAPPGVRLDALPPIDVVLQSHDHYDHLDEASVQAIARAHPGAQWFAPVGVGAWLGARGVRRVRELDWWGAAKVEVDAAREREIGAASGERARPATGAVASVTSAAADVADAAARAADPAARALRGGPPTGTIAPNAPIAAPFDRGSAHSSAVPDATNATLGSTSPVATSPDTTPPDAISHARVTCLPAQHFSGRGVHDRDATLWCGWSLRSGERAVYFAGDSGLHPEFEAIARRAGPFDLALLPIGAYAPRWFMRPVHADPADAIDAYRALVRGNGGRRLACGGMHWGTFKLTDEPLDEPPRVMRERWMAAGLDADDLWVPACGETRSF